MFKRILARQAVKLTRAPVAYSRASPALVQASPGIIITRYLHSSRAVGDANSDKEHAGMYSRTDPSVQVEYPEENELPSSKPVQGRGGKHMKRTLPGFSMEGKVVVVTGGARGLGYVIGQGLIESGASLAIVDLNRE